MKKQKNYSTIQKSSTPKSKTSESISHKKKNIDTLPSKIIIVGMIIIVLMIVFAYFPAMFGDFVWDDVPAIQKNILLKDTQGLINIWFNPSINKNEFHYWPMVYTFLWIEHHLWGVNTFGYHLVSTLLHILNTLLLWKILRRLAIPGAWLAAALFGIHPVHVESVAWMVELKDVLSGTFYLLALYLFIDFEDNKERHIYLLSIFLFVCALLTKSITVTLPIALLLLLWWKSNAFRKQDIVLTIPYFVASIAYSIGDFIFTRHQEPLAFSFTIIQKFLIITRALCFYIGKIFLPYPLMAIYPRWTVDSHSILQYTFPIIVIAVLIFLWMQREKWGKGPLAAVLFFAVTLTPILGFINYGYMDYAFVADRFQYLASIGIFVLFAALAVKGAKRFAVLQSAQYTFVVILFMLLIAITLYQSNTYKNKFLLFTHNITYNPNSPTVHFSLGDAYYSKGDNDKALYHFEKAISINPYYAEANNNLAFIYYKKGDIEKAIEHFSRAVQLKPKYGEAHSNLGLLLFQAGKIDEAIYHYQIAMELEPLYPEIHENLANAYFRKGNIDEAILQYQEALKINPDYVDAHNDFANALLKKGDINGAIEHLETALKINPKRTELQINLASVYYSAGKYENAIEHYSEASKDKPNDASLLYFIGNSYFSLGENDKAIKYFSDALRLKPDYADAHINLANIFLSQKNTDEAIMHYEEAIRIDPQNAPAYNNLGVVFAQKNDLINAMKYFEKAIEADPHYAEAHNSLGLSLTKLGKYKESIPHFEEALKYAPDNVNVHKNFGNALIKIGNTKEGVAHLQKVMSINPNNIEVANNLAWILATNKDKTIRNGNESLKLIKNILENPENENAETLDTLAAAYAETGQFKEAVQIAQKALELAQKNNEQKLTQKLEKRLQLYKANQPYRENE